MSDVRMRRSFSPRRQRTRDPVLRAESIAYRASIAANCRDYIGVWLDTYDTVILELGWGYDGFDA